MQLIPVTNEKLFWEVDTLYQQTFGIASVPGPVQFGWWQAWPQGMAALQHQGTIAGAISCWPVKRSIYEALCAGTQREKNIDAVDIETKVPQYFHLSEIVVLPNFRGKQQTAMLVQYMLSMLGPHLQPRGEVFLTAYAYSSQGSRLMQYLKMQQLLPASATADAQSLWHIAIAEAQQLKHIAQTFVV